jgi:hypothetical protein
VVSREEIRKRLWPEETVVEFDLSINAAIRRLRNALRDSADNPRYVKTLARRGYCFIGEVETDHTAPAEPVAAIPANELTNRQAEETPRRSALHLPARIFVPVLLAAMLIVSAGSSYYRRGARRLAAPLQPLIRLDADLGSELSPRSDRGGANAILSPDGTRLVYAISEQQDGRRAGDRTVARRLRQHPAATPDGTGQPQLLTPSTNLQLPTSFTDDGKRLAFLEITPASGASDVWTVSVESGSSGLRAGKPELFLQTPFRERMPMISPDGRWMAYQSNEPGGNQVYVQAFPDKHAEGASPRCRRSDSGLAQMDLEARSAPAAREGRGRRCDPHIGVKIRNQ